MARTTRNSLKAGLLPDDAANETTIVAATVNNTTSSEETGRVFEPRPRFGRGSAGMPSNGHVQDQTTLWAKKSIVNAQGRARYAQAHGRQVPTYHDPLANHRERDGANCQIGDMVVTLTVGNKFTFQQAKIVGESFFYGPTQEDGTRSVQRTLQIYWAWNDTHEYIPENQAYKAG